jgi:trimeric autotransporter adhesin
LDANTTGGSNVAVGANALGANTTGSNNVCVGISAAIVGNGSENTIIGHSAGSSLSTGYQNVFVGSGAGSTSTTGFANILIGREARNASAGNSGEIVINASGSAVSGKGSNTGFIYAGNAGGIFQGNNSSNWSTVSDQRIKKNIVENTEGLEIISQLRVCNFEYRLPEEVDPELKPSDAVGRTGVQLGVIAQELQQVCPDCVTEQSTGVLSVNTDEIFWHMINAIKELKAEVDALKSQINGA